MRVLIAIIFFPLLLFPQSYLKIKSGAYTGNGSTQSITGVGFQPKVVWIRGDGTAPKGRLKTDAMPGARTMFIDTELADSSITSLDSDGFSLAADDDVNASATNYIYTAITGTADLLETGSFESSTTDNVDIPLSNPSLKIGAIIVLLDDASANTQPVFRTTIHHGDSTSNFRLTDRSNIIQSIGTGTFQRGNDTRIGQNGITAYYIVFADNPNCFDTGQYTGNAADNRTITTNRSFEPDFMFNSISLNDNPSVFQTDYVLDNIGDRTYKTFGNYEANNIQAFGAGTFEIGSDAGINSNGNLFTWFALANYIGTTTKKNKHNSFNSYKKY